MYQYNTAPLLYWSDEESNHLKICQDGGLFTNEKHESFGGRVDARGNGIHSMDDGTLEVYVENAHHVNRVQHNTHHNKPFLLLLPPRFVCFVPRAQWQCRRNPWSVRHCELSGTEKLQNTLMDARTFTLLPPLFRSSKSWEPTASVFTNSFCGESSICPAFPSFKRVGKCKWVLACGLASHKSEFKALLYGFYLYRKRVEYKRQMEKQSVS